MKTLNRFYAPGILYVLSILLLSACGGGGGGGAVGPTSLATGAFTKTVDGVGTGSVAFLFAANSSQILQQLYLASEINGAGFINRLSYRIASCNSLREPFRQSISWRNAQ